MRIARFASFALVSVLLLAACEEDTPPPNPSSPENSAGKGGGNNQGGDAGKGGDAEKGGENSGGQGGDAGKGGGNNQGGDAGKGGENSAGQGGASGQNSGGQGGDAGASSDIGAWSVSSDSDAISFTPQGGLVGGLEILTATVDDDLNTFYLVKIQGKGTLSVNGQPVLQDAASNDCLPPCQLDASARLVLVLRAKAEAKAKEIAEFKAQDADGNPLSFQMTFEEDVPDSLFLWQRSKGSPKVTQVARINKNTGGPVWTQKVNGWIASRPSFFDLFVEEKPEEWVAMRINKNTGGPVWTQKLPKGYVPKAEATSDAESLWDGSIFYGSGSILFFSKEEVSANGEVSTAWSVFEIDEKSGEGKTLTTLEGERIVDVFVGEKDRSFVTCNPGFSGQSCELRKINKNTGGPVWTQKINGFFPCSKSLETSLTATDDGVLLCGKVQGAASPSPQEVTLPSGMFLFNGSFEHLSPKGSSLTTGAVYRINKNTGGPVWTQRTGGRSWGVFETTDGTTVGSVANGTWKPQGTLPKHHFISAKTSWDSLDAIFCKIIDASCDTTQMMAIHDDQPLNPEEMVSLPEGFQLKTWTAVTGLAATSGSGTKALDGFWIAGTFSSANSPQNGELSLGWVDRVNKIESLTIKQKVTEDHVGEMFSTPPSVFTAVTPSTGVFLGLYKKGNGFAPSGFQTEAKHMEVRCKEDGQSCAVLVWANSGESFAVAPLGSPSQGAASTPPLDSAVGNLSVFQFSPPPQP